MTSLPVFSQTFGYPTLITRIGAGLCAAISNILTCFSYDIVVQKVLVGHPADLVRRHHDLEVQISKKNPKFSGSLIFFFKNFKNEIKTQAGA